MRIALLTQPGRGDTEPFVALAIRLKHRGHQVVVTSRPELAAVAEVHGVDFVPVGNPYQPFIDRAARAGAMGSGHPIAKLRFGLRQQQYVRENLQRDVWHAVQDVDLIIYKYPWVTAHTVAQKLGVPSVPVMLLPLVATRSFPTFMMGRGIDRGRLLNRMLWTASWQAVWLALRVDDRKLRRQLGLPALPLRAPEPLREGDETPVLCEWSEAVLPKPSDWPEHMHVTGYWFVDPPTGWQPPAEIQKFLDEGPPPVSIGFGSMISADRETTLSMVLSALELSGQRGILLSGWSDLGRGRALPSFVARADDLPHSWLFPRAAAVVHHGGAGTTGAALRAGIPAVVTPLVADQPSWAKIVHSLGAGPAPIPFRELTAARLADAIRQAVGDPAIRQRAQDVGARLQREDGIGQAVELLLRYAQG